MSADHAPIGREEPQDLQFDRVETAQPRDAISGSPTVACVVCKRPVGAEYYAVNGKPVCANCRERVVAAAATPRSASTLLVAALFGIGAAIAGAAIYYAVIAIAHLEIGIVAILIGYMVGWAVRKGSGGRGGRRFQILAVVLTYWAVGLAYAPLAFKGGLGATGSLFLRIFALPVLTILGSLPFGLISALIIFIGMRQAWSLTAARALQVTGPYRVGAGPAPATG
jgi:hypothetical protein